MLRHVGALRHQLAVRDAALRLLAPLASQSEVSIDVLSQPITAHLLREAARHQPGLLHLLLRHRELALSVGHDLVGQFCTMLI